MICSLCSFNNSHGAIACERCGKKFLDKKMPHEVSGENSLSGPTKTEEIQIEEKNRQKHFLILVVEDNSIVRLMVHTILNVEGYRIIEATDGRSGINKALQERPDLILMDILLPALNGVDAISILKRDPKTRNIPVIAISCLDTKKDVMSAIEAGCNDYVKKPFTPELLVQKIQKFLPGTGPR
ncbi:MAG: response regulator [Candidatus Eremiobacterota bacterium]